MKIYTDYGNRPATKLEGVFGAYAKFGGSNADCLWTRRWRRVFCYCSNRKAAPGRDAAVGWLGWQKGKVRDFTRMC